MSASDHGKLSDFGFVRISCAVPRIRVGDVRHNVNAAVSVFEEAANRGSHITLFPELGLTGYTCADLFHQDTLLGAAMEGLAEFMARTGGHGVVSVVGLPVEVSGRLYNCAAMVCGGELLGLVPKTHLPNTNEYYEQRWFTSGNMLGDCNAISICGGEVPIGIDLLFPSLNVPDCVIGIEVCEDLWAVQPPSGDMALAGATVILNPSASLELLGKASYRRELVKQQSARCLAAYAYTSAGPGESTTDVVFSGHALIAENGMPLAESDRLRLGGSLITADVDVRQLRHERLVSSSFSDSRPRRAFRRVSFSLSDSPGAKDAAGELRRPLGARPFVPDDPERRAESCREIFTIQATGLAKRLLHTKTTTALLGLSGGLDSTLALLVCVRAFDELRLPRAGIVCVTMPGFGTTARTKGNAARLAESVGASLREISITEAVRGHFRDIGHDERDLGVTYENAQARERTQILMDIANKIGGLVVGTGDLSEAALGWCTYSGDHISMYHVNAGVPKTLVRYLVEWCADEVFSGESSDLLRDVCATPISPELLPTDENGELVQETEAAIGPYELHDFFLYYTVRRGCAPSKVLFLAERAFGTQYAAETLKRWLIVFYRRFFSQQFKRSCTPDGPKVGSVALSPRGDWRMPSDAEARCWLDDLEGSEPGLTAPDEDPAPIL